MLRTLACLSSLTFASGIAALPASAACGSPYSTITRPGGGYSCYMNCTMASGDARPLSTRTVSGPRDVIAIHGDCISQCMRTPGCTSVSYSDWYKGGVHYARCTLWTLSSEATTESRYGTTPGADYWVCHLDSPGELGRDPRFHIDTDKFRQDQYRPGVPGPSVPRK